MITVINGNIIGVIAQVKINTINCVGAMGKGVAYAFKIKYPKMYRKYRVACSNGEIKIGTIWPWYDEETNTTILNVPTKDHWRNSSTMEYVELALSALKKYIIRYIALNHTIAIPALGCGNGGLDWGEVLPLMHKYLKDLRHEILIINPYENYK